MKDLNEDKPKKSLRKKIFLYGLATLAAGLVSYFGFQFWKKNKEENNDTDKAPEPVKQAQQSQAAPKQSNTAPKSKPAGSKTTTKTTAKTNSKHDSGHSAANSSDKSQAGSSANTINAAQIAADIHTAILKKDFTGVFNQLKLIKNVSDYSAVSKVFLKTRTAGKPQTLVSGLLSSFKTINQRAAFLKAFIAMGLKYDGKKWSLSGTETNQLLITTQPTKVWLDPKNFVQVPVNMVLGHPIAKRGDFSVFENEKQYFLVESNAVNYYTN